MEQQKSNFYKFLHKLENNDVIEVEYNGKSYKYKVFEKQILSPEEVNPLATLTPAYLNEKTLSLMTCTPPGTTLKRLIVGAKQIEE
jgi:sortase A